MVKNPSANAGHMDSIPGQGISPGEGNGNSLQCSCLGNPMDRRAWWATVAELDTTKRLSTNIKTLRSFPGSGVGTER